MMVKICGITNLDDALAAAEHGAGAVGFNFYNASPRYISPSSAAAIGRRLPPEVLKVGVFVNEYPARVEEIRIEAGLDRVQLHGDEPPEALPPAGAWRAIRMDDTFTPERLAAYRAEAFLLDAAAEGVFGGSGVTFAWSKAKGLPGRIILAGGLNADNVAEAIRQAEPWGVDACSRLESAPGRKDRREMARFLRAALGLEIAA